MLNKNVADYTNFDGKTNKKILQAPGGASSFSLAWSNQKTDYGPERNKIKPKYSDQIHNQAVYSSKHLNDQPGQPYSKQISMGYDALGGPQGYKNYELGAYGSAGSGNAAYGNGSGMYGGGGAYKGYAENGGSYGSGGYGSGGNYGGYGNGGSYGNNGSYDSGGSYGGGYGSAGSYGSGSGLYNAVQGNSYGSNKPSSYSTDNSINQQINAINYSIKGYNGYKNDVNSNYQPSSPTNSYNSNQSNPQMRHASQANYSAQPYGGYQGYKKQTDQLDLAIRQHDYNNGNGRQKSVSAYESAQYNYRPSVKVLGPPPQQFHIGDANYNYWKQDKKQSNRVQKKKSSSEYQHQDRTSVRVNNPPGGKQTLTLG